MLIAAIKSNVETNLVEITKAMGIVDTICVLMVATIPAYMFLNEKMYFVIFLSFRYKCLQFIAYLLFLIGSRYLYSRKFDIGLHLNCTAL